MKTVIFDYDGTLVQVNIDFGMMRQDVEACMVSFGVAADPFKGFYTLEMIDEVTRRMARGNLSEGRLFHRMAHELVTGHEIRAARTGKILPGVVRMLDRLQKNGIKVGVITRNCDKAVKAVFPHLEELCDAYSPRDGLARVKPHPDHLALLLGKLGLTSGEGCFMVGDHVIDVEAGRHFKMKTAGVLTGKTTGEQFMAAGADLILYDAPQILRYLF